MPRKSRTSLAGWRPGGEPDPLARARRAERWLAETLGLAALEKTPAAPFDAAAVPASRIDRDTLAHLTTAVGSPADIDPFARADHALGQSYPDVLRRRSGKVAAAPDAILSPADRDAVQQIVRIAGEKGLAIIPFGGGTSVVGGVTTPVIPGPPVVVLDMRRMDRVLSIDRHDARATAEAGIAGPALEQALAAEAVTLGHTPQSFEYSTLGGWIAAGGSGQQSSLYGPARSWFVSARLATPQGIWASEDWPASAAGPRLGDLIVGSEGTLGVILDATMRIRPSPTAGDHRGFAFADFAEACEAIRQLAEAGVPVATLRLSDSDETHFLSRFSALRRSRTRARIARTVLRFRRVPARFCLLIVGIEGTPLTVARARADSEAIIRRHHGMPLGRGPGKAWLQSRFEAPSLRDALLDRGIGVDTVETATTWSRLAALHQGVRKAIAEAMAATLSGGARGIVMCHVGHACPDGASLYFTFAFPRKAGAEIEQWRAIKEAAGKAILDGGGTISHQHGIGTDHREGFLQEKGEIAIAALRGLKTALDPAGIMNPGKLGL